MVLSWGIRRVPLGTWAPLWLRAPRTQPACALVLSLTVMLCEQGESWPWAVPGRWGLLSNKSIGAGTTKCVQPSRTPARWDSEGKSDLQEISCMEAVPSPHAETISTAYLQVPLRCGWIEVKYYTLTDNYVSFTSSSPSKAK